MARRKMTDGNRRKVRGKQKPSPTAAGKVKGYVHLGEPPGNPARKETEAPLEPSRGYTCPEGGGKHARSPEPRSRQAGTRNNVEKSLSWGVGEQKTWLSTQQILPSNRKE